MSLPVTTVPDRREAVVNALLKMAEVGLFRWTTDQWMPKIPDALRENPTFSPAGLAQVKTRLMQTCIHIYAKRSLLISLLFCVMQKKKQG